MDVNFTSIERNEVLFFTSSYLLSPYPSGFDSAIHTDESELPNAIKRISFHFLFEADGGSLKRYELFNLPSYSGIELSYRVRFFSDPFYEWKPYPATHTLFSNELSMAIHDEQRRLSGSVEAKVYLAYPILCQFELRLRSMCGDKVTLSDITVDYNSFFDHTELRKSAGGRQQTLFRLVDFADYQAILWGMSVFKKLQTGNLMPDFISTFSVGFRNIFLPICIFFGTMVVFGERLFRPQENKDIFTAFLRAQGHFPCSLRSLSEMLRFYRNRVRQMFLRGGPVPFSEDGEASDMLCNTDITPFLQHYKGLEKNFIVGRDRGNSDDSISPVNQIIDSSKINTRNSYFVSVRGNEDDAFLTISRPDIINFISIWGFFKKGDNIVSPALIDVSGDVPERVPSTPPANIPALSGLSEARRNEISSNSVLLSATDEEGGSCSTWLFASDTQSNEIMSHTAGWRGRDISRVMIMNEGLTEVFFFYYINSPSGSAISEPKFDFTISLVTKNVGSYLNVFNKHVHAVYSLSNPDYSVGEVRSVFKRYFLSYDNSLSMQVS